MNAPRKAYAYARKSYKYYFIEKIVVKPASLIHRPILS